MISPRLEKELNAQINREFYSAYLYLSMSAYFAENNLSGFSNWMKVQFEEEQAHAMKMYNFLLERGGKVELDPIEKPKAVWEGIVNVYEEVLAHEQTVTASINDLVNVAIEEKDHATVTFLQWYVNEQVEEEASVSELLEQLRLIEGKGAGLFMLDREAKQRVFVPISGQ